MHMLLRSGNHMMWKCSISHYCGRRSRRRRILGTRTHFCELIKITLQHLFKQQTTKRRSLMRLAVENFMDIPIL